MATKQGTKSKGASKIPLSAAEQAAVKDSAQAHRTVRTRDTAGRFTPNTGLADLLNNSFSHMPLTTREDRAMAELLANATPAAIEIPTQKNESVMDQLLANFINQFGTLIVAKVVKPTWSSDVRAQVREYAGSLVKGDGNRPKSLNPSISGHIDNIFCGLCFKMIIGNDVLPGQRQQWYQSMFVKSPPA